MKYKTLKQLRDAYASGKISREDELWIDNDCSGLHVDDKAVWRGGGPEDLLFEALELLGIPAKEV